SASPWPSPRRGPAPHTPPAPPGYNTDAPSWLSLPGATNDVAREYSPAARKETSRSAWRKRGRRESVNPAARDFGKAEAPAREIGPWKPEAPARGRFPSLALRASQNPSLERQPTSRAT